MSDRLLTAVILVQSALLLLLVAERLVPTAQAQSTVHCEVANWPSVLTNSGFSTLRVRVEEVNGNLPVEVKDWNTSDEVKVTVGDWNTSDTVRVDVTGWNTSSTVNVRQQ